MDGDAMDGGGEVGGRDEGPPAEDEEPACWEDLEADMMRVCQDYAFSCRVDSRGLKERRNMPARSEIYIYDNQLEDIVLKLVLGGRGKER